MLNRHGEPISSLDTCKDNGAKWMLHPKIKNSANEGANSNK